MLNGRLTCMIHTCDKYSDLWRLHAYFLNMNWQDRNIDTFLVTDKETDISLEGIDILSAGDGTEMSQRVGYSLGFVKTEYVLMTLDDYFPIYNIESDKLVRLLDIMDKENVDYIRLFPDPNSHKRFKNYKKLYRIPLDVNYSVNLYQGIWRKSFLEKTINDSLNAWQYEVTLTRIANHFGATCLLSKGNEFRILDVIRKGKLLHKADKYLKRKKLSLPERSVISYKEEIRIWIFNHGKKILPRCLAKKVKEFLKRRGRVFYSDSI